MIIYFIIYPGHWLAIEGVQPAIIQNPTPTDKKHDVDGKSELESKLTAKQVLSKELQLYYDKIVEAVLSDDKNVQKLAIDSLENDPGIQPILPYLIQFVTEKVGGDLYTSFENGRRSLGRGKSFMNTPSSIWAMSP